jgi:UDP-glucuronate decarboxylase
LAEKMYQHINSLPHYNVDEKINEIVDCYSCHLRNISEARILLTGGSGFFGFWTILVLAELHRRSVFSGEVFIITRSSDTLLNLNPTISLMPFVHILEGCVTDIDISELKPDHLIHFASTSATETFNKTSQVQKLDTLYLGTKNILEQCGPSLKKVLFASSGAAYGSTTGFIPSREEDYSKIISTSEDFALCIGKINAEFLISNYSKKFDFDFSIARCFSFCGEYMPLTIHYAFGNFISDALKGKPLVVYGDGSAIRSYMYIGDAIAWLFVLLLHPKNNIYNMGAEEQINIQTLAELIARKADSKVINLGSNRPSGNFERSLYVPNTTKIRTDYGELKMLTELHEVISRMLG